MNRATAPLLLFLVKQRMSDRGGEKSGFGAK
jgi:hypothetical protein